MAKYTFIMDYDAKGTNLIPAGSEIANFIINHTFKKGDVVDGEYIKAETKPYTDKDSSGNLITKYANIPETIRVKTSVIDKGNSVMAVFSVPKEYVVSKAGIFSGVPKHINWGNFIVIGGFVGLVIILSYFSKDLFKKR